MFRVTSVRLAEKVGISGTSVYVPRFKVDLQDWCEWTGNKWDKVENVVGSSFRVTGPNENAYTMAANAVLNLVLEHDINPQDVGFIGLGTESSTDNSAGAVIVKGMVDAALEKMGKERLSRNVEVPEFKHACLGGVYALKNACRYAEVGRGKKAIVVASDIAEYERGTSGEPTQGAGAVAMLVEQNPQLLSIDHRNAGSSASYRGPDFRKPVSRHFSDKWAQNTPRHSDFPVFSGPYSTTVYTDTTIHSVEDMLRNMGLGVSGAGTYFDGLQSIFLHRPYKMMPIQAMSAVFVRGLVRSMKAEKRALLEALCEKAGVHVMDLEGEVASKTCTPDPLDIITDTGKPPALHVLTGKVAKALRSDATFLRLLEEKMSLGSVATSQFGNLYSASLPAWLATGMQDAAEQEADLAGRDMVAIGYGSGDASEAIPMQVEAGWREAALKTRVERTLADPVLLTKEQYEAIHDTRAASAYPAHDPKGFHITHVGDRVEPAFQDLGIEYYAYAM